VELFVLNTVFSSVANMRCLVASWIAFGAILFSVNTNAGTNGGNYNMGRFLNERHPFSKVKVIRPIKLGESNIRPLPNPQSFLSTTVMPTTLKRFFSRSAKRFGVNAKVSVTRSTISNSQSNSFVDPVDSGSYYSIGTFRFIQNAQNLKKRYETLQPSVVLFEKNNNRFYRVIVGPIAGQKKKQFRKSLVGLGLKGFWKIKIDGSEKKVVKPTESENGSKLKAIAKINGADSEIIKYIPGNNRSDSGVGPTQKLEKKAEKLYAKSILPQPLNLPKKNNFLSEIRVGTLWHDEGLFSRRKERGIDGNLEILFSAPHYFQKILSPRPHLGASINSAGDTNQVYIGLTWEGKLNEDVFTNFSFGGGYHDGYKVTDLLDRKSLGCRILFRESIDLGFRFDTTHSIMAHLDHISNAKLCSTNEGLESVGIRYGYNF